MRKFFPPIKRRRLEAPLFLSRRGKSLTKKGVTITMKGKNNVTIRTIIAIARVQHREIAKLIGVTETSFSRMLAKPLSEARAEQIEKAVNEILRKRSEKKGRLEKALEAKGIDRNKAAHSLFLSREELDELIDKPKPQQDKLIDYLVTRVEAIKES